MATKEELENELKGWTDFDAAVREEFEIAEGQSITEYIRSIKEDMDAVITELDVPEGVSLTGAITDLKDTIEALNQEVSSLREENARIVASMRDVAGNPEYKVVHDKDNIVKPYSVINKSGQVVARYANRNNADLFVRQTK